MARCTHCDRELRWFEAIIPDNAGGLFHLACAEELQQERNAAIDAQRKNINRDEDWELESRRHEEHFPSEADRAYTTADWEGTW